MKLGIFNDGGPLEAFCRYVASNLNVRVVMMGKNICASKDTTTGTGVVYIPSLEMAREEDVKLMLGFALHEAGHLRFSNYKVLDSIHDYYLLKVHNALEDVRMERRVEKAMLGARAMFKFSHEEGYKLKYDDSKGKLIQSSDPNAVPILQEPPHFRLDSDEGIEWASQVHPDAEMDDLSLRKAELMRVLIFWIRERRKYKLPLGDWPSHEWKPLIDEVTKDRPRRTIDCLDQAKEICRRLDIPFDEGDGSGENHRPVNERDHEQEKAKEHGKAARGHWRKARQLVKSMKDELRKATKSLPLKGEYEGAMEERREASANNSVAVEAKKQAFARKRQAIQARKDASEDLRDAKRLLAEAKRSGDRAMITIREQGIRRAQRALDEARDDVESASESVARAKAASARRRAQLEDAKRAARDVKEAMQEAKDEAERPVREEWQPRIDEEEAEASRHDRLSYEHESRAKGIQSEMDAKDEEATRQVPAAAMRRLTDDRVNQFKGQSMGEEFETRRVNYNSNGTADDLVVGIPIPPARKYTPYTRAYDSIRDVHPDMMAAGAYADAVNRNRHLIDQFIQRLKRLKSPIVTRQRFDVEEGMVDDRYLVDISLAMRGVPRDLERVYKTVDPRPKPKAAVQLLLDCSNSLCLNGTWDKQLDAVVVAAEVLPAINIPVEVLGHTTSLYIPPHDEEDLQWASRVVPFRGLVFKPFPGAPSDKSRPKGMFSSFEKADNIDGEAVLWGASRLCDRDENLKFMFCLSDGDPQAVESNCAELQRHLYMVVKTLEEHEKNGLVLHGIGIGTDRSKDYFNNSSTASEDNVPFDVMNAIATELEGRIGRA